MQLNCDSKMEVEKDTRNELFKRQELVAVMESDSNPSFADVRKEIAEKVGKAEDCVDVFDVQSNFGKKSFKIRANVYDSKEDLDAIGKLGLTRKQRKEGVKEATEEKKEGESEAGGEEKKEEVKEEEDKPAEAPVEDKPEEESKTVEEEKQSEEESKE